MAQTTSSGPEKNENATAGGTASGRVRALIFWALGFLAFRVLAPYAAVLRHGIILPAVLAAFMLLSLTGPRLLAPLPLRAGQRAALFCALMALSLLTAYAQNGVKGGPRQLLLGGYSDLFLIGAAGMLGQMLAGLFREPNILAPVAVVAGLVDYWGVNYGTTQAMLQQHPEIVKNLSVQAPPIPGVMEIPIGIGFGDFVFLSLFLACAHRLGLREKRTFWLSFALLLPAAAIVALADVNIPALVPMAAAFLIANAGRFRFQPDEVRAMAIAALLIVVLVGAAVLLRGPAPRPAEQPRASVGAAYGTDLSCRLYKMNRFSV